MGRRPAPGQPVRSASGLHTLANILPARPSGLFADASSHAVATGGVRIPGALFMPAPAPGHTGCLWDLGPPPSPISGFGVLGDPANGSPEREGGVSGDDPQLNPEVGCW